MTRLASLIARFRSDERGMFAVMFGVIAIVLIATAGAVVDFVALQQARTRAQVALDAAALALQPEIFKPSVTEESIRERAEALVRERLAGANVTADVYGITTSVNEGSLVLQARLEVPTAFVRLVGVNQLDARLQAEATRKRLTLEIVMVLDNSGSMAQQSRMTHLKSAARCATNILFYGDVTNSCDPTPGVPRQDNVKIGLVPFTMLVNIGANNSNASWLDWTGAAAVSKENFDSDDDAGTPYTGLVNRANLFSAVGESWAGCVIARESPYDVNDTTPTVATPATLFTPFFAPDEPSTSSTWGNSYLPDSPNSCTVRTCTENQTRVCTTNNRGRETCTWTVSNYTRTVGSTVTTSNASCRVSGGPELSVQNGPGSNPTTRQVIYSMLTNRELQERLCKYHASTPTSITSTRGPNANCPSSSILALTDNDNTVRGRISDMVADGGTNIHQGAMWGFHALSPSLPFAEGDDYDTATYKVMILMTDGENYASDYQSYSTNFNGNFYYNTYGYRSAGHISGNSENQLIASMNVKTVETCNNAKAAGIMVYTIGLSAPNESTKQMLRDCSSGPEYQFFPNQPSELNDVFRTIADQLTRLRLAQ